MYEERSGETGDVYEHSVTINSPAPHDKVMKLAEKVGIDPESGTPASVFDAELHGDTPVKALIKSLKKEGHDGAVLGDIPYGIYKGKQYAFVKFTNKSSTGTSASSPRKNADPVKKKIKDARWEVESMEEALRLGIKVNMDQLQRSRAKLAALTNNEEHCECGGECDSCKEVENANGRSQETGKYKTPGSGSGIGEVHKAAQAGMACTEDLPDGFLDTFMSQPLPEDGQTPTGYNHYKNQKYSQ